MTSTSTGPIHWGIGGVLVSYGLLRPTSWGRLAVTAGVFMLAVKAAEAISWVASLPSPRSKSMSNLQQEEE